MIEIITYHETYIFFLLETNSLSPSINYHEQQSTVMAWI